MLHTRVSPPGNSTAEHCAKADQQYRTGRQGKRAIGASSPKGERRGVGNTTQALQRLHARNKQLDNPAADEPRANKHHEKDARTSPLSPAMQHERGTHYNLSNTKQQ